jgi:hypothetical protein
VALIGPECEVKVTLLFTVRIACSVLDHNVFDPSSEISSLVFHVKTEETFNAIRAGLMQGRDPGLT